MSSRWVMLAQPCSFKYPSCLSLRSFSSTRSSFEIIGTSSCARFLQSRYTRSITRSKFVVAMARHLKVAMLLWNSAGARCLNLAAMNSCTSYRLFSDIASSATAAKLRSANEEGEILGDKKIPEAVAQRRPVSVRVD